MFVCGTLSVASRLFLVGIIGRHPDLLFGLRETIHTKKQSGVTRGEGTQVEEGARRAVAHGQ